MSLIVAFHRRKSLLVLRMSYLLIVCQLPRSPTSPERLLQVMSLSIDKEHPTTHALRHVVSSIENAFRISRWTAEVRALLNMVDALWSSRNLPQATLTA